MFHHAFIKIKSKSILFNFSSDEFGPQIKYPPKSIQGLRIFLPCIILASLLTKVFRFKLEGSLFSNFIISQLIFRA